MKNFLLLAATFLSVNAFARSGAECYRDLVSEASFYENFRYLQNQVGGVPSLKDCKNIVYNGDGASVHNKVYITADGQNLIIQNNQTRALSLRAIPGGVVDWNVMAGRLILATKSQKLLVVSRSGSVLEILTSEGNSFYNVESVKIDPTSQDLIVNFVGGRSARLDNREVTYRLNDGAKFRAVSF